MTGLARWVGRHPWPVVAAWLLVLVVGFGVGSRVFDRLSDAEAGTPGRESTLAEARLENLDVAGPTVVAVIDGADADDAATRTSVTAAVGRVRAVPGVVAVQDPYATGDASLRSVDGRAVLVVVRLDADAHPDARDEAADAVAADLRAVDGARVLVAGQVFAEREFAAQAEQDLVRGELVAFPVLLILLVVLLGGLVGGVLPLVVAAVGVGGSLLVLYGLSGVTSVADFAVNAVTMVGLGLAVDYALLLVTRFREERGAGHDIDEAVRRTMATAGHTVLYSALTVAVAMAGLLVFPEPWVRSIAFGALAVVVLVAAAALTLTPAMLAMIGRRLRPIDTRTADHGIFARIARLVQRRAALLTPLLMLGLAATAVPFTDAELRETEPDTLPRTSTARQVYDTVQARFPQAAREPIRVLADTGADDPALAAFTDEIAALPGVTATAARPVTDRVAVIEVQAAGDTQGHTATTTVARIRALDPPFPTGVTGAAAKLVDTRESLAQRLPWALGLIAATTFVLLFLFTGSVVAPVKAMVMNCLSLGVSFGALVWIFQQGHLSGLLGFTPGGYLDPFLPILVAIFAFGLSMDYEVFLLGRIKERYDATGDNDRAVAEGLQRTGRIVTAAALLMTVVFAGLAAGQIVLLKALGLGLALAVVVDATIVRTLLVPATMTLLGRANWWAPAPLRRLHARVALREPVQVEEPPMPQPARTR